MNESQKNKRVLRKIFLNLLTCSFIIMCYFYLSQFFGSISLYFIDFSNNVAFFGLVLIIFTFFSALAGPHHGFITGFMGEYLYQLAFYNTIYLHWCFIIAIWGLISGIFMYNPLKYQERMNLILLFIILIVNSILMIVLIIIFENDNFLNLIDNFFILIFLIQLIGIVIAVPALLFLYDKILAHEERFLYFIILTHHPITMSDHTFYFKFGRTYIYLCSRCSGVMIGGLMAYFFTCLLELIYNTRISPELAVLLCIILPIPGVVDWGTQRMLFRKSTTESRLFTGFIIGVALHLMSYTTKYYFFMVFILTLYFSLVGLLIYFGHKKEMRLSKQNSRF
ncbi:MAG: DUF2085 domain-containing protein [Promethearchaeota archaeon]|nr:MAG: DUF2085 domain-containing protein [Candidatus Lokiarchaeota archaeon]